MSAFGKRGGVGGGGRPTFGVAKPMKGGSSAGSGAEIEGGDQFPPIDELTPPMDTSAVENAGGALGGYTDPQRKKQRLAAEGVTFSGRRVRRFADLRWAGDDAATPRRRRPV